MDAIPSLCASSVSCAIGAIGHALGQSRSIPVPLQLQQSLGEVTAPKQQSSSTTPLLRGDSHTFPRARPATSPQPRDPSKRSSTISGLDVGGDRRSFDIREHFSALNTVRGSEQIQKRSSWYHRFSTVTPSIDGSVGSPSVQQPSTPSVFSNGSSATPFFGQPISTVTPNKLVKRSTSYKGLPSEYLPDSSLTTTARVPTFRRPATSHQRSETLRLRHVRQSLATFDENADRHSATWSRKRDRSSVIGDPINRWRPFFQFHHRRFAGEPGSRRSSGPKFFGGTDHITFITKPIGGHATLVKGNCVDRPNMDTSRSIDPLMEESLDLEDQLNDSHIPDPLIPKTRHSISIETRRPLSIARKLTRGSSLRKPKPQDSRAIERRIVSAPLQTVKPPASEDFSSTHDRQTSQNPPSPLPQIGNPSTFEVDLRQTDSSNRDGPHSNTPFDRIQSRKHSNNLSLHTIQNPLRMNPTSRTGSRVPSDKSTAYGSDTENNLVFSVDGDDTDYRSETYYDSLRTDASGSSHSGARNHRVDHVFGEHKIQDSIKEDLATLQERFSKASLQEADDGVGENESIETPTWRSELIKDDHATSPTWPDGAIPTSNSFGPNLISSPEQLDLESSDEESWDDELGIDSSLRATRSLQPLESLDAELESNSARQVGFSPSNKLKQPDSETVDANDEDKVNTRPKTSHQPIDRGGRSAGRRPNNTFHARSQSVPLPPDHSKHKFNNAKKLDNWVLGNKGVSEDWDNDFEFDEGSPNVSAVVPEEVSTDRPAPGIVIPRDILERQATVHGQFGQVKELSLLVEQLRDLYQSATVNRILDGQSSELWKEAAGIIDLASLDEDEGEITGPSSPTSTSFELDNFDDDSIAANLRRSSNTYSARSLSSSPNTSRHGTPQSRPKSDSIARAKNVLANIHQHRDPLDPLVDIEVESVSPSKAKKMPFDTTSLRDLVTRAGVVTRACREIIRRVEDPNYVPHTPERRPTTPPDPPFFSQLFQPSPTPSSPSANHRSTRTVEKVNFSTSSNDQKVHGHNVSLMTVV